MTSSKSPQPPWSYSGLQSVAAVLADTSDGLTGSEIGDPLSRLDMQDPLPGAAKRVRLAEAFIVAQNRFGRRLVERLRLRAGSSLYLWGVCGEPVTAPSRG